ncbi:MAG: flagellar protein FlgN [Deltaproteobacteria bacterium]|jgi:flagellar biosynthesis/type III secretory pathway chaperone|nr:flagellar protein FlgN [Deltaproteobacteria bacterium]
MDYRSLIVNLEIEINLQTKLLEAVREEKIALAMLDEEKINKVVESKQQLIEKIQANQEKRNKIFIKDTLAPLESLKLEDLIANCSSAIYRQQLEKLQSELKEIVVEMRELNNHNAKLTKQSLGLIATTLAILKSANHDTNIPSYSPKTSLEPVFSTQNLNLAKTI